MKKISLFFFMLVLLFVNKSYAQQGKYIFYCEAKGGDASLSVKGEYQGKFQSSEFYYEKNDALNHKIKEVNISRVNGKFSGMDIYEINETNILVSNLRVKEEKSNDKTFFTVKLESNSDKKPIMFKHYIASKGAFDPEMNQTFSLNVPFATKAKAEAFIKDILAAGLR